MPARLVVLISGRGSNLKSIIDNINAGTLAAEVVAVISNNPSAPGLGFAGEPVDNHVIDHTGFKSRLEFDSRMMEVIDFYQPDLVVLAGFMRILTSEFVNHYAGRLINIHPSLLPKFKGTDTHKRALAAKEIKHGASVHFVTEDLDSGPVIMQAEVDVRLDDTEATLAARVLQEEHKLYPAAIAQIIKGKGTKQT
jgi:phosphoribosylglycinamide formyltransferase-1